MNHIESRDLTFNDVIPAGRDESDFCVAFVTDRKTHSLRFLTGCFSPERLGGEIVWFPLIADVIHTIVEIYKRQDMRLDCMSWSVGQPYFNNLYEMGCASLENKGRKSDESMMALTATAYYTDDE